MAQWRGLLDDSDAKGKAAVDILRSKFREIPKRGQRQEWVEEVQDIAGRIPPQHLTHHLLRQLERHKIRVSGAVSFHRFMVEQSESRKLNIPELSWLLNNKITAYNFVDKLGVRRPLGNLQPCPFNDIDWQYPGVLKAVSGTGGRGIYLTFAPNNIVHVSDGKQFSSFEELAQHAESLMSAKESRSLADRWIMEELILEDETKNIAARDIKFFCFYGEVLFVLEVIRDGKNSQYSFILPDGSHVRPGDWNYKYFEANWPSATDIALAEGISKKIPHPFLRIDMLLSENGLVFGEFTPRPGGFQRFNAKWDRLMGEAWLRAQDRLQRDLLTGKQFNEFLAATGVYDSQAR